MCKVKAYCFHVWTQFHRFVLRLCLEITIATLHAAEWKLQCEGMAAQIEMVDMPNPEPDRSSRHANSEVAVARSYPGNQNESEGGRRKRQRELQWFDISCLIINKVIGSGIFISPALVVLLTGSKWAALLMWIFGSLYSFARYFVIRFGHVICLYAILDSILIYLEYGLAWPFNGGEFVYVSLVLI